MNRPPIRQRGETSHFTPHQAEVLRPAQLHLSQNTTLSDCQGEWTFFTPALWYIVGRSKPERPAAFDLYAAYIEETQIELQPHFVLFHEPVFAGLVYAQGDQTWNYVLHCLPKDQAQDFIRWTSTIAIYDRARRFGWKVGFQPLIIKDPVQVEQQRLEPEQMQEMSVGVFTINSTRATIHFRGAIGLYNRPTVVFDPPLENEATFFTGVEAGAIDPYKQTLVVEDADLQQSLHRVPGIAQRLDIMSRIKEC